MPIKGSKEEEFEPFLDDIYEYSDFSSCFDLYIQKRFSGDKEACSDFELLEFIEELDDESYGELLREAFKNQNVSEIIEKLYLSDRHHAKEAAATLSNFIALGNKMAYEGLLKYYNELPSAVELDDVHLRIEIVKALSYKKSEPSTIDAYVNELIRTPSNNTTRKLYSEILDLLAICPIELIDEPLTNLLEKRQYAY